MNEYGVYAACPVVFATEFHQFHFQFFNIDALFLADKFDTEHRKAHSVSRHSNERRAPNAGMRVEDTFARNGVKNALPGLDPMRLATAETIGGLEWSK